MGVNGLWNLLTPVARPVAVETLANRRLAIDTSLWIYQFQMSMRDKKSGEALQNAHIMGTFRRIMKLMYHGVKPVFVFDGEAPAIKRRTIAERKKKKTGATRDLSKTAAQLLSAQLRAAATDAAVKRRKELGYKEPVSKEAEGGNVVYFDDLENPDAIARSSQASAPSAQTPSPPKKKYVPRDQYALPQLDGPLEARAKPSDPRIATEEELRNFIDELRPEDFDVDSSFFGNLPTEVKYEILGELRIKSRQVNRKRVELMKAAPTALDFSKAQIANVMQRNSLTQKLLSVTDELGQAAIPIPQRVAGHRNKQYVLVKQSADKGGGWVLGVQDPVIANNAPVVLDTTSDESVTAGTDSDDFEEVEVTPVKSSAAQPAPDHERKQKAMDAIKARYSPQKPAAEYDPYLDQPFAGSTSAQLFAHEDVDDLPDDWTRTKPDAAPEADDEDDFEFVEPTEQVAKPLRGADLHTRLNQLSSARLTNPSHPLPAGVVDKPFAPAQPANTGDSSDEGDFEEVEVLPEAAQAHDAEPVDQRRSSSELPGEPVIRRDFADPAAEPEPSNAQPLDIAQSPSMLDESDHEDVRIEVASTPSQAAGAVPTPTLSRTSSSFELDIAKRAFSITPAPEDTPMSDAGSPPPANIDQPPTEPAQASEQPFGFDGTLTESESEAVDRPTTKEVGKESEETAPTKDSRERQSADDDEEFFEWEKSPTPPPRSSQDTAPRPLFRRRSGSSPAPSPYEEEANFSEQEEQETMENLRREQEQYADMLSMLKNRNLQDMQSEARDEIARLTLQRNEETRAADAVTVQMSADIRAMLVYFGIPFVDAPSEAEAECANLLSRGLVDGVVTDDSDVFLFGAERVYRNMFNDNKYVECYLLKDLERELGLDRDTLIRLQYLLGGDYTDGLAGVGPVLARELLIEFPGPDGLRMFRNWWMRVQKGQDTEADTNSPWRRRFKKGHKGLVLDESWPDPAVAKAFKQPNVSSSDEPFSWGGIDLDGLRHFLKDMLTWGNEKVDDLVLPLIKRQKERSQGLVKVQGHLGKYFDISAGSGTLSKRVGYSSERLQNVVQSWRRQQAALNKSGDEQGEQEDERDELPRLQVKVKKKAPRKTTATGAPRKRGRKQQAEAQEGGDEGAAVPRAKKPRKSRKKAQAEDDEDDDEYQAPSTSTRSRGKKRASAPRPRSTSDPTFESDLST